MSRFFHVDRAHQYYVYMLELKFIDTVLSYSDVGKGILFRKSLSDEEARLKSKHGGHSIIKVFSLDERFFFVVSKYELPKLAESWKESKALMVAKQTTGHNLFNLISMMIMRGDQGPFPENW